ncbi:chitobiase/beta-hexosaminidase C-terminal domain-containing protein [Pendulispora rubella]|uniref:Chitobiase/beta-hexosaminidase C-terminal domain-containing protein n=1 Tax=Pendulispora rubella TaxID=2741070 RepID=A0ABZ2L8F4_9BACT
MLRLNVGTIAMAMTMAMTSVGLIGCADETNSSGMDTRRPDADLPRDVVLTPEYQPGEGTFEAPQNVTIMTATEGATIHYTLDGSPPDATSVVYTVPLVLASTTTLKAIALKPGLSDSQVRTGTFTIQIPSNTVAPVQFEPNAGNHSNDVAVTLASGTPNATICYTLDDSVPACSVEARCTSGTPADGSPVPVTKTATRIRAIACKSGMLDATPTQADYTLTAAKPTFEPRPETYDPSHPVPVTLATTTQGGQIHYTTDGTTPYCGGTPSFPEKGTIPAFKADTTVRAIACKGNYAESDVVTMKYLGAICVGNFDVTNRTELEALSRCTEITGNLDIKTEDVSDLAPLSHLALVRGTMYVGRNTNLRSLHGLEALTEVDGTFWITDNRALESLDGLSALQTVGRVFIVSADSVLEWNAPATLTTVGALRIHGLKLRHLTGFAGLKEIREDFEIASTNLTEFTGMPALTRIGAHVSFRGNSELASISGFENVREVGGDFFVGSALWNPTRFVAFPNLTTIGGSLFVAFERTLTELNFASLETIRGALDLADLPALTSLQGFPKLNRVGDLYVEFGFGFANLKGLEHLTTIDHAFWVKDTTGLVDLVGLENLTTAEAIYIIESSLQSLRGLDRLTRLDGLSIALSIYMRDNYALTEIGGLDALTHVAGGVVLERNPHFAGFSGFHSLAFVGGELDISNCGELANLAGLEALQSIGGNLTLFRNRLLDSVDGLSGLSQLGGNFSMRENQTLPMCQPTKLADRLKAGGYTGTIEIRNNGGTGTCN